MPLPIQMLSGLLGVPPQDRARFERWSAAFLSTSGRTVEEMGADIGELTGYMADLIVQRRAEPRDDLLSALANARDKDESLTDAEILPIAMILIIGGFDNTATFLATGVLALLRSDEQRAPAAGRHRRPRVDHRRGGAAARPQRHRATRRRRRKPGAVRRHRGRGDRRPAGRRRRGDRRRPHIGRARPGRVPGPWRCSTSGAPRTRTSRSATACTTASGRRSPAWSSRSGSPNCSAAYRSCAWKRSPGSTSGTSHSR